MIARCKSCFQEYNAEYGVCPHCGYAEGDPPKEAFCLAPGTEIAGRYLIGEKIGVGGFGIVYRAWDRKLEKVMAVKEYYPNGLVNRLPGESTVILVSTKKEQEFRYKKTRFLDEARNLAKFSTHKNIVNVFDYFEANQTAYIVMELLSGQTLAERMASRGGSLSYDECTEIAAGLCCALREIHGAHILHRDISPDNIMVCENGGVKLFDFGEARFSSGVENIYPTVKPGFAPPEQYDRINRQGPWTDLYALGATMYYAMTGKKPEESTNRIVGSDDLPEPVTLAPDIPPNVNTTIMRAMAIEPRYRFRTIDEFEQAFLNEKKVATVEQERKRRKQKQIFSICAAVLLVFVLLASFLVTWHLRQEAVTLPDAALTVWYIREDTETSQAKQAALRSIADSFTGVYENVTVTLKGVDAAEYAAALEDALAGHSPPAIYESTGLDPAFWETSVSLTGVWKKLGNENYYTVSPLPEETRYPTGITVPIIFVRSGEAYQTTSFANLLASCEGNLAVSPAAADLYTALYGSEVSAYSRADALEEFLAGEVPVLLGSSTDYFTVQAQLPGIYDVLLPDSGRSTYEYGTLWSLSPAEKDTQRAATAFLQYLTSDVAQDYLYIRNHSTALPVAKAAMEEYVGVYGELSDLPRFLELPFRDSSQTDDIR